MVDIKQVIAKNITDLRLENSMTQLELANRLNYSDKAISKWERGESVPDVGVLKEIADIFGVSLDYLVKEEHKPNDGDKPSERKIRNRKVITGMCILLVWLVATFCFVVIDIIADNGSDTNISGHWLAFVYAIPVSFITWLVFNSIWFNQHRNYAIISLLMWSILSAVYFTFLPLGYNIWLIFTLGLPAQIIIIMWSRLKYK